AEKRWTPAHQQLLIDSRVRTTAALVEAMAALAQPPRVLVQASAVGYYGTSSTAVFREASPAGDDFLSQVCQRWETAAAGRPPSVRLVTLRIGIVLGPDGGALGKMLPVFRLGFGGPVGSGQQWMSWIHRQDLVRLIATALEDPAYSGTYNAVAPEPVRMGSFSSTLGSVLGRPSFLPVPAPLLQLLLGDGAKVVLEGQQVQPERLQQQGFPFRFPDLSSALVAATSPGPR
ncbi:MAG: TIGR01777 family oxidoreductase, partial [Cyanobium sp.]